MTTEQAHKMLTFHQRMARAYRSVGEDRQARVAEKRAAECQAVLQVERYATSKEDA